jgi:small-conductance mechanosensitive channel
MQSDSLSNGTDKTLDLLDKVFFNPLFTFSGKEFNLTSILIIILSIWALSFVSGKIKNILAQKVLPKYSEDTGFNNALATIIRYVLVIIGLMVIIQSTGLDLSSINILAGAIGVGIGFGLQNVANNFISGLIILFERPIKVGDRIQVGEIIGNVVQISGRSTTINTNDNISVIVPNSQFINEPVINWSYHDRMISFRFPVGVSYKEDPKRVKELILEVARLNPGVLDEPKPDVLFDGYGDSSLNFLLRVWTNDFIDRPTILKSQLYYAIFEKFKENGIEIPFPQRDLHLKSGFEGISKNV